MSDLINRIYGDFDKKNEFTKVKIPKFATGGICNDAILPSFDMFSEIDEIVKDIRNRKDNAIAMEFTKCIGELLRKNGVAPKITEYKHENVKENSIESMYRVSIDGLDFFEHDKVFEDKIAELKKDYKTASELLGKYQQENESLKQRIAELENKETVDLPFDPLETANYIINATYNRKTNSLERSIGRLPEKVNSVKYTIDDLEQIAEHLLIYCKHNKECEE